MQFTPVAFADHGDSDSGSNGDCGNGSSGDNLPTCPYGVVTVGCGFGSNRERGGVERDPSISSGDSWGDVEWVVSLVEPLPPTPPPPPVCTTSQCITAANVCGQVNIGSQNSCTGNICSATIPANPSGSCSVATACGVNATGFVGCNGACNITRYPFCASVNNPNGDGEVEWITLNGSGAGGGIGVTDVRAEIFARPTLVVPQGRTVVRWISTEATSCSVAGANGDAWTGTTGEKISGRIAQETQYVLTCTGFNGAKVSDSVTVRIVPEWQEF